MLNGITHQQYDVQTDKELCCSLCTIQEMAPLVID